MAHYTGLTTVNISSFENFKNAILGNGYDVDGVYGEQCVDLAKLLAGNAGRTSPYWKSNPDGYAYEGWTNTSSRDYNAGSLFTLVYNKADVKIGDLVVLSNTTSNPYGHIAFATTNWDSNTSSADLLGQNQVNPSATVGHETTITNVNVTTFLGAFRFIAWQPSPPTPSYTGTIRTHKFNWPVFTKNIRNRRNGL